MNLSQLNRILRQALLLPMLALLLMAGALLLLILGANRTVGLIQQSDARITRTARISKLIVDEETGLRGYQTTSDPRFLQPYLQAKGALDTELPTLNRMPGTNHSGHEHIGRLIEAHRTWQDSFAVPLIGTIQSGGNTNDVQLNLHGKTLMDGIRAEIGILIHQDEDRRAARIVHWNKQVREIILVLILLALLMGVAIGLFTRDRLHNVSDAYRTALDAAQRRAETIYDSEQELRTTLSSIGDGVITCDADGRVSMMNPVAEELTGWTQKEANGRPLEEVFLIVNDTTRQAVENPVTKVKRLNRIVGMANHTLLLRRDGAEICIADSGAPIRNKMGEIAGIVLVFRDVTIEKKTQDTLLANEKLVVAGRLAATIAHEIHNPLDSVSNLLYLIRSGVTEEESRQFMAMAEQELARVTQISRAMLGLYRESKAPVEINLSEMLQEILLLLERRISDLRIAVATDLPANLCIEGFPAELRQVFTNLITNAAEAASPGGQVRVTVTPRQSGLDPYGQLSEAGALVEVSDNGPGISSEVQSRLFQPFFTTKGEHGTGLGLWVSRGIVNKHGGTIALRSDTTAESHGTVASVFLATHPRMQLGGD